MSASIQMSSGGSGGWSMSVSSGHTASRSVIVVVTTYDSNGERSEADFALPTDAVRKLIDALNLVSP